jgi:hypothetical protein
MARCIIDLSIPLENGVAADPPGFGPKLAYFAHRDTVADVCRYFQLSRFPRPATEAECPAVSPNAAEWRNSSAPEFCDRKAVVINGLASVRNS